jgi:hypothetical protein
LADWHLATANRIIISCAGDNELASDLYDYLIRNLKPIKSNIEDFATLTVDEIEIVDYLDEIPRESIRSLIQSFLDLRSERVETHTITELENVFTIGIKTDLLREMKLCEYCGYISKDYHDMYQHRLLCAAMTRFGL